MKKKLFIGGMSCQNCIMYVASALKELDGVKDVEVNLKGGYGMVGLTKDIDDGTLKDAIHDAGYDLVRIEDI